MLVQVQEDAAHHPQQCELFLLLLSDGRDGLFSFYVGLAEKWVQGNLQRRVQAHSSLSWAQP